MAVAQHLKKATLPLMKWEENHKMGWKLYAHRKSLCSFCCFLILQKDIVTDLWVFCLFFSNLALTLFFFAPCRVAQGEVSDVLDIEVEAFAPLFRSPGRNIPLEAPWMILGLIKWYLESAFYRGKGYTLYRGSFTGDEGTNFFGLRHRWKQSRVEFNQGSLCFVENKKQWHESWNTWNSGWLMLVIWISEIMTCEYLWKNYYLKKGSIVSHLIPYITQATR